MARLTAAQRRALPDSAFAGPGRTFPIENKDHARAALMDGAKGKTAMRARKKLMGPKGKAVIERMSGNY